MQGILVVALLIAAAASRPIEVRLWRAGRITDRTTALLLVGRFSTLVLLYSLIQGYSLALTFGVTALGLLPVVLLYGFALRLLRDERAGRG
jgi:hypothetical protein